MKYTLGEAAAMALAQTTRARSGRGRSGAPHRTGAPVRRGSIEAGTFEEAFFAVPGKGETDADLLAYCRATGGTIYHPTSTCRMGADEGAVVDTQLRVRGVERLRVADCSIMPTVPSGNTNAGAIMIGERCAAFVRAAG